MITKTFFGENVGDRAHTKRLCRPDEVMLTFNGGYFVRRKDGTLLTGREARRYIFNDAS